MERDIGDFADALEGALSAESRDNLRQQRRVLDGRVFIGLPFERFGSGQGTERFFRGAEFLRILERCEAFSIGVCGLEVFTAEWRLLAVEFNPQEGDRGAAWCHDVVKQWNAEGLLFAASYYVPDGHLRGEAST
jgi:hypothetical protein